MKINSIHTKINQLLHVFSSRNLVGQMTILIVPFCINFIHLHSFHILLCFISLGLKILDINMRKLGFFMNPHLEHL